MTMTHPDKASKLDEVAAAMHRLHDTSGGLLTHATIAERLRNSPLWVEEQLEVLETAAQSASAGLRVALSGWVAEQLAAEVRYLQEKLKRAEDDLLRAELTDVGGQALEMAGQDDRRARRERLGQLFDEAARQVAACDEAAVELAREGR